MGSRWVEGRKSEGRFPELLALFDFLGPSCTRQFQQFCVDLLSLSLGAALLKASLDPRNLDVYSAYHHDR